MITHEDKKEKNAKVKALKKNRKLMKENDIDHNDDDVHKKVVLGVGLVIMSG